MIDLLNSIQEQADILESSCIVTLTIHKDDLICLLTPKQKIIYDHEMQQKLKTLTNYIITSVNEKAIVLLNDHEQNNLQCLFNYYHFYGVEHK